MKNGSTNIGMEERMDGIASMLFRPFASVVSQVRELERRESTKGVNPL